MLVAIVTAADNLPEQQSPLRWHGIWRSGLVLNTGFGQFI